MTISEERAAELRELISKATQEDLADGGRYFADSLQDLTRCRHSEIGEYQDGHDGELIEWLWNRRGEIADLYASTALATEAAQPEGMVAGDWREVTQPANRTSLKGLRRSPKYYPAIGETCRMSGPNCDDAEGYTWLDVEVLWRDDLFIVTRVPGCWPTVTKLELALFEPLAATPPAPLRADAGDEPDVSMANRPAHCSECGGRSRHADDCSHLRALTARQEAATDAGGASQGEEAAPRQGEGEVERAAVVAYLEACAAEADRQAELLSVAGKARAIEACREEAKAYRNSARMIERDDHAGYRQKIAALSPASSAPEGETEA